MVAISFQDEFVDALLRGDKQQTTRLSPEPPKLPRIKAGDIAQIYIKQRHTIISKPIRQMTGAGTTAMADRVNDSRYLYPTDCPVVEMAYDDMPFYYAHFLGKVEIIKSYEIQPNKISDEELEAWAKADGFKNFAYADMWFMSQYDGRWMELTWTVSRWVGWSERYFEPMVVV